MIICCDFDGTLLLKDNGKDIPNKILIKALKKLQKKGHKIILWTCREGKGLQDAIVWCRHRRLKFDAINENLDEQTKGSPRKVIADMYIDDSAVSLDRFLFLITMNDKLGIAHHMKHKGKKLIL